MRLQTPTCHPWTAWNPAQEAGGSCARLHRSRWSAAFPQARQATADRSNGLATPSSVLPGLRGFSSARRSTGSLPFLLPFRPRELRRRQLPLHGSRFRVYQRPSRTGAPLARLVGVVGAHPRLSVNRGRHTTVRAHHRSGPPRRRHQQGHLPPAARALRRVRVQVWPNKGVRQLQRRCAHGAQTPLLAGAGLP